MKHADLSLRQLNTFVAVAQAGSFAAASEQLFLSPSVLSRTVASIERTVGTALFDRTARRVELTATGRELLTIAERVMATHHHGMRDLAQFMEGFRGTVTVATLPSVAAILIPPAASVFRKLNPDVSLRVLDGPAGDVVGHMTAGDADMAVTWDNHFPRQQFRVRPLVKDRFVAILPSGHPRAKQAAVTWTELAADPFITLQSDTSARALTDHTYSQLGTAGPVLVEARNISTVGGLVGAGMGVAAMTAMVGSLVTFADVVTVPLVEPEVERILSVVEPLSAVASPATAKFVDVLLALRDAKVELPRWIEWLSAAD